MVSKQCHGELVEPFYAVRGFSSEQSGDSEDAKEFIAQAMQEMMASIERELRSALLPEKDGENV